MVLSLDIPDEVVYSANETKESLIVLTKRKLALELYRYHKITLSQAALLCECPISEFMTLAGKENIDVIDNRFLEEELFYAKTLTPQ